LPESCHPKKTGTQEMSPTTQRFNLIIEANKYSDGECHDIAAMLCFIRDCDEPELTERLEQCLQAFINRKRLGTPVVFKKLREEFNIPE